MGREQRGQRAAGIAAQVVLVVALWLGVGLGPVGWLVGIGSSVVVWAALTAALRGWAARLGPADGVTQARAVLVGGAAALVADHTGDTTVLVALASVALALDAVDGRVARRTGTASVLGARFDMEVDALLVLVLSVRVAPALGWWVLAIGAMRYVFGAAARVAPWLRAPPPPSLTRKAVGAVQGVTLTVACSSLLPRGATVAALVLALGLLVWSFGRDTRWSWRAVRCPVGGLVPDVPGSHDHG